MKLNFLLNVNEMPTPFLNVKGYLNAQKQTN